MDELGNPKQRHQIRWSKAARELVLNYVASEKNEFLADDEVAERTSVRDLVTRLVELTGNSREACRRFSRQLGVTTKQQYRGWTKPEQQRLLNLIVLNP